MSDVNNFNGLGGHRASPWLSGTRPRGIKALGVRATEEVVGHGLWIAGGHMQGPSPSLRIS